MDSLTPKQRHYNMSRIRAKNTSPELNIRSALFRAGFRYRTCDRRFPGTPDIVLPRYYAVIFIHGCFWHAHEQCPYYRFPKSNKAFWIKKFTSNRERDARIIREYQERCWRICVVWECSIRGRNRKQKIESAVSQIIMWLEESNSPFLELRGEKIMEGTDANVHQ